jgi:DNA-binding beta-propeller fold protein YncE
MSRSTVVRKTAIAFVAALLVAPALAADPAPLELAQTIRLSGPVGKRLDNLALDAKRDRLLVANQGNASLDIIDLKQGKLLKSIPDQQEIQGVLYVPGSDRIFATSGKGSCNVFDGESLKLLKSLPVPDADNIRQDARTGLVYVTRSDKKLAVFEPKSLEAKGEISLPSHPESFVFEKDRHRMYINLPAPRQVAVVDTDKREILKRHQLDEAGNYPLALDESNKRLLVGCRKEARLLVLDTETGKELSRVTIPNDVDGLYLDAKNKRLYASCGEGFLVVLKQASPDRYEVLTKMPTVKQARTCLFDPDKARLFLPIPRTSDKEGPEIRVYRAVP